MYQLPQEIEAKFVIPALRRDLSKCLVKGHGVSYEKVGKLLGVTKAAVSQYLSGKRASKIKLHVKIGAELGKSCDKIMKGKSDSYQEITRILKYIRKNGLHCEVCGKISDGELHDCNQLIVKYDESD
jgi:uncharacterized protein